MATHRLLSTLTFAFAVVGNAAPFKGFGAEIDGYIHQAAKRYQVEESMLRGLVKMEDGWQGKISPTGATGVGQFTMGTWNWLSRTPAGSALGMQPVTAFNRGTVNDPRKNKRLNTYATALLARWHIDQFKVRYIPPSAENLYMAHNIGMDGLYRALQGKSTKIDIENMRKNGMKPGMTVNDFLAYQKRRYRKHQAEANFAVNIKPAKSTASIAASIPKTKVKTQTANVKLSTIDVPKLRYSKPQKKELAMRYKSHTVEWVQPSQSKITWVLPQVH